MTIAMLRRILDRRDPDVWTQPQRDALEALATRYMGGEDTNALLNEVKALVPPKRLTDANASRAVFGAWLMNRASRHAQKLLE